MIHARASTAISSSGRRTAWSRLSCPGLRSTSSGGSFVERKQDKTCPPAARVLSLLGHEGAGHVEDLGGAGVGGSPEAANGPQALEKHFGPGRSARRVHKRLGNVEQFHLSCGMACGWLVDWHRGGMWARLWSHRRRREKLNRAMGWRQHSTTCDKRVVLSSGTHLEHEHGRRHGPLGVGDVPRVAHPALHGDARLAHARWLDLWRRTRTQCRAGTGHTEVRVETVNTHGGARKGVEVASAATTRHAGRSR